MIDDYDQPPPNATNGDTIRWAFEMLNRHDVDPLKQFWRDDTVEHFPDRTCRGAQEIAGYFEDGFAAMPDSRIEVLAVAEQGEDVFVHWHLTGTHKGTLMGIAPTSKRPAVDGMDYFIMRDGNVVSNFVVFDQMQYARQIGMLPPDGSPVDTAGKRLLNLRDEGPFGR